MNWKSKKNFISGFFFLVIITALGATSILVKKKQLLKKGATGGNPSMELSSAIQTTEVNQSFDVAININTGTFNVSAIDAVINFPKDKLELTNITPAEAMLLTSLKTFVPVLSNNSGNFNSNQVISQANANGQINFGAVAFDWPNQQISTPPFINTNGANILLATLTFKAISGGQAEISVLSSPGSTTDSNLVKNSDATDILANANAITINISQTQPAVSPTATPIPTTTPTPSPTATPTTTPKANLNFKIKFQGINSDKGSKTVKVILRPQDGQEVIENANIAFDQNVAAYSGSLSNINPGNYDILIKESHHLQKKFADVILEPGDNEKDWTDQPLIAGDFNNTNQLGPREIANILSVYNALSVPVNSGNRIYDINEDGQIDGFDIALVLEHYYSLVVNGDN